MWEDGRSGKEETAFFVQYFRVNRRCRTRCGPKQDNQTELSGKGEILGRKEAMPATRATLEMIGRLAVDIVIPGHGAPFDDVDAAMARALRRLESFEADSTRVGRNAVRACFTFNLLDLQRLREDELPAYLKSVPFFDHVNVTMLGFSDEDFASWLLGELLRSKSIELKDGWILPTMAP